MDPPIYSYFRVILRVHRHVLSETSLIEGHLSISFIKISVPERDSSFSHVFGMLKSDIVELLVPLKSPQPTFMPLTFTRPKLISQIQAPYPQLFTRSIPSRDRIVSLSYIQVNFLLEVAYGHNSVGEVRDVLLALTLILIIQLLIKLR